MRLSLFACLSVVVSCGPDVGVGRYDLDFDAGGDRSACPVDPCHDGSVVLGPSSLTRSAGPPDAWEGTFLAVEPGVVCLTIALEGPASGEVRLDGDPVLDPSDLPSSARGRITGAGGSGFAEGFRCAYDP